MKLWTKESDSLDKVSQFTVGDDLIWDAILAPFDVLGSIAHTQMLAEVGLLTLEEGVQLREELSRIYHEVNTSEFRIPQGYEDIHSFVEMVLTERLGEVGKKIHSARSRNDQVLVDTKLYLRQALFSLMTDVNGLVRYFLQRSELERENLLPGYTHYQLAMPSSFGLWFGAYAESLLDDAFLAWSAWEYTNRNPLGSAAGYGSSFPINRDRTTALLGFEEPHINVVAAQMSRGKTERVVAQAMANFADTLSRMANDLVLYSTTQLGYVSFAKEWTTGSSIMPHKKNPDVMELIRAKCNQIKSLPNELFLLTGNLPSGYHRDLQLVKDHLFPSISLLSQCISILKEMIQNMEVNKNATEGAHFEHLFTVERVNELVLQGIPFRDAYKQVGMEVENGSFVSNRKLDHKHLGSIGHLGNDRIFDRLHDFEALMDANDPSEQLESLLSKLS